MIQAHTNLAGLPFGLTALTALTALTLTSPGTAQQLEAQPDARGTTLRFEAQAFHTTDATVSGLRQIDVGGSSVSLLLWDELAEGATRSVPHYGISMDGSTVARVQPAQYALRFEHGAFDPLAEGPRPVETDLRSKGDAELFVVQFHTQPLEVFLTQMRELGARVHTYVADYGYAVRMDPATRALVEELPYVRWVGAYHPAYRVEPFLRERLRAQTLEPDGVYNVLLFDETGSERPDVVADIRSLGGGIQNAEAEPWLVEAVLSPDQLMRVAALDAVQYVDRWSAPETDMNIALTFSGGITFHNMGMTGFGVAGEVMDTSFQLNHDDFDPAPLTHGVGISGGSHGTSTYGIVFGNGDVCRRGALPDGTGIYSDVDSLNSTSRSAHFSQLLNPTGPYRAVFQSNSWGNAQTTSYTSVSASTDTAIFVNDFLMFNSQSNTNSRFSRPQAWAKNVVAVGGINHQNTNTPVDDNWGGASIGPASDGRIKPDLAHFYDATATTTSGSPTACTSSFGGTSGATPITAGHMGLMFELWHTGVLGNPTGLDVFESRPHYTTMKALAIANSAQWAFSGTTHNLTRVHQGWGRVNLNNLLNNVGNMFWVDETDVLENFDEITYDIVVSPGQPKLQATLTWSERAGNPAVQSQHRLNDLNLRVTSPSGTVYFGNNGLLAENFSSPGGVPNTLDTVENVILSGPEAGTWSVTVAAAEIVSDNHVETAAIDADFALVVVGGTEMISCAPAQTAQRLGGTNPVSYTVTGGNLGGTLQATIDLSTTGHDQALLFGFDSPTTIGLGGGQTLLAIDGGSGEMLAQLPVAGPLAVYDIAVPNDAALCGMVVHTQAVHFGTVVPFALSNAQDLTIGN